VPVSTPSEKDAPIAGNTGIFNLFSDEKSTETNLRSDTPKINSNTDSAVNPTDQGATPYVPTSMLKEKLLGYIDELKSLQSRDLSQKNHKLEQIAVLEERLREIDLETTARKRVIQMEIDELRHQIETMEKEKDDIRGVLDTFQKEITP
jgi:hypothetical protein